MSNTFPDTNKNGTINEIETIVRFCGLGVETDRRISLINFPIKAVCAQRGRISDSAKVSEVKNPSAPKD